MITPWPMLTILPPVFGKSARAALVTGSSPGTLVLNMREFVGGTLARGANVKGHTGCFPPNPHNESV